MSQMLNTLPDSTRLWIFGADRALTADETADIERTLRAYVSGWAAHGAPLDAAVTVLDHRFVVVAVDERSARASGCSIDDMVRQIAALEREHAVSLLDGTLIFYRNAAGLVESCDRETFRERGAGGAITARTLVIDPTTATLGAYRAGAFERPVSDAWHRKLLPVEALGPA